MKNKKEQEQKSDKSEKILDKYWILIIVLLSLFTVVMVGLIIFTQMQVKGSEDSETEYKRHYMFVSRPETPLYQSEYMMKRRSMERKREFMLNRWEIFPTLIMGLQII